jgi:hypothetical protein
LAIAVGRTTAASAIAAVEVADALEVRIAIDVVAARRTDTAVAGYAHLAVLAATPARAADEVGADLVVAEALLVRRARAVDDVGFAAEKAHEVAGGLERRAHLRELRDALAFDRATVCVLDALVRAVTGAHAIETQHRTEDVGVIDLGIAVGRRGADRSDLIGAALLVAVVVTIARAREHCTCEEDHRAGVLHESALYQIGRRTDPTVARHSSELGM